MSETERRIQRVLVVGSGTMGTGIAQVAAQAGCSVWLLDRGADAACAAKARIGESLSRAAEKGYVDATGIAGTLERVCPLDDVASAPAVDAAIEAVTEDLAIKHQVMAMLERRLGAETPIWTNTSMVPISRIGAGMEHPQRLAGVHFFNPVPRMKLVEIIAGAATAEATAAAAERTVKGWGKTPVRAPDTPGFLVNRIFDAIKREALQLLEEGSSPEQIDTAVRLGLNFPMGPFEVMDLVGLDTTYQCLCTQAAAMNRPAAFGSQLPGLIERRELGRKTGKGFYSY